MINVPGVSLSYGSYALFSEVNIKFVPGNCYGLIGATGSGKSTFLQMLSGENTSYKGMVSITPGERIFFLRQDHFTVDNLSKTIDGTEILDRVSFTLRKKDKTVFIGFLGRMLFSGDEATKKTQVLSGGERVRCMLAKMMLIDQTVANRVIEVGARGTMDYDKPYEEYLEEELVKA